jgi:type VI protein secretion system component VasA
MHQVVDDYLKRLAQAEPYYVDVYSVDAVRYCHTCGRSRNDSEVRGCSMLHCTAKGDMERERRYNERVAHDEQRKREDASPYHSLPTWPGKPIP